MGKIGLPQIDFSFIFCRFAVEWRIYMKKTLLIITLELVIVFSALSIPAMALTDMEGNPIPDL